MTWHHLAFAAIPVWVWFNLAGHKPALQFAEDNDRKWWGGYPLTMPVVLTCIVSTFVGSVSIGVYAATGHSPF